MLFLFLFLCWIPSVLSTPTSCDALYQLNDLAQCALKRSYQNYENYGCSCSGMSPNNPVDSIDKCCQVHNNCYDQLLDSKTCQNAETPNYCNYQWSCSANQQIVCYHNNNCLQGVCLCDSQLMACLAPYPYPAYPKKCNNKGKEVINVLGMNITIITEHHGGR